MSEPNGEDKTGEDPIFNGPIFTRYAILRKNFVRELVQATIFIACFAVSFLIGYDFLIIPLDLRPISIFYCVLVSFAVAIVITVPIGLLLKFINKTIEKRKMQKQP